MRNSLLILFLFLGIIGNAQINKNGIPFVTNYSPDEYNASEQNWAIVQDHRGVMYFGNNDHGILEYDGETWRKIPISNNSIVRSLAVDSLGIVYVGGVNEFGKLQSSIDGQLKYESLLQHFDTTTSINDVWKTYTSGSDVYFCTFNEIFKYNSIKNETEIITLNADSSKFTFLVNDQLFNYIIGKGLHIIDNNKLLPHEIGHEFSNKEIFYLSGSENELIIGSIFSGIYKYKYEQNSQLTSTPLTNDILSSSYIYNGTPLSKNRNGLATLSNGLVILDKNLEITNIINSTYGLRNQTIPSIYNEDKTEPLWLGLNDGIAKIELNTPLMQFNETFGLTSQVYDIIRFNGKIILATSSGLSSLIIKNNYPTFEKFDLINDQVWSVAYEPNSNKLYIGASTGIFVMDSKYRIKEISNNYYTYKLKIDNHNPDQLVIGHNSGLSIYSITNKTFKDLPNIEGEIRSIAIDSDKNMWAGSYFNGVYKLTINPKDTLIQNFTIKNGLPSDKDIFVFSYNSSINFGTQNGVYSYDQSDDYFYPYTEFNRLLRDSTAGIFRFNQDNNNNVWISAFKESSNWIEYLQYTPEGFINKSNGFQRFPKTQIDVIFHENDKTWFGSSNGLYLYQHNEEFYCNPNNPCLIRKVIVNNDSIVYHGYEQNTENIKLFDYVNNDIKIEFSLPYYIQETNNNYTYQLKGYKNQWSPWSNETKAVFTNLREGKYSFLVKAKNIYGIESENATYNFIIKPPYYRTILAYIIYGLVGLILVIIIVKIYTRRLELEKIRLEGIVRERTAEIREQKDEIEKQADDLKEANITLTEQKEEISKQKEEITASIKYAKRIQKAVVPNEETAACLLKNYFLLWRPRDIVSGDFWWLSEKDNQIIVAAADCTGHGVPGAFMSMLGVSFLNEIVNQQDHTESHKILNHLRHKVKTTLGQTGKEGEAKDGMDIALLVIDFEKQILQFSGAYNPLLLIRNGEIITYKADRNPIGIYIKEKESFTQNIVELEKGDTLYIFSDGYVDQFGGKDKMKYTSKRFKQLLLDLNHEDLSSQKSILNDEINKWMGDVEQIDDIIVLGIRI